MNENKSEFISLFSEEFKKVTPITFRKMKKWRDEDRLLIRSVNSKFHNSSSYSCDHFWKSIARTINYRNEEPKE